MNKAIVLSRVSTLGQDLTQQTEAVIKRCRIDGYSMSNIIVIEDKESAVNLSEEQRLGLIELKNTILSDSSIKCVYAFEISRIGRRAEVNYSIRNFLRDNRVQLIILNPSITLFDKDFNFNESDNMIFAIFNGMAENEGFIRKVRMKRGKAKAKEMGRWIGGPVKKGYKLNRLTHRVEVDEEKAEIIKKIFNMYISGMSCMEIGRELKSIGEIDLNKDMYASQYIRKIIKNNVYLGNNIYPRIIDEDTWNKKEELLKRGRNKEHKTSNTSDWLLKNLMKDYVDGLSYSAKGNRNCYLCFNNNSLNKDYIEKLAIDVCYRYIGLFGNINAETINILQNKIKDTKKKIIKLNKDKEDITDKIDKVWLREIEGRISTKTAQELADRYKSELNSIEDNINQLNQIIIENDNIIAREKLNTEISIYDMDTDSKKKCIRDCIEIIKIEKVARFKYNVHFHYKNGHFNIIYLNCYTGETKPIK